MERVMIQVQTRAQKWCNPHSPVQCWTLPLVSSLTDFSCAAFSEAKGTEAILARSKKLINKENLCIFPGISNAKGRRKMKVLFYCFSSRPICYSHHSSHSWNHLPQLIRIELELQHSPGRINRHSLAISSSLEKRPSLKSNSNEITKMDILVQSRRSSLSIVMCYVWICNKWLHPMSRARSLLI
jgi:hypothetical protein